MEDVQGTLRNELHRRLVLPFSIFVQFRPSNYLSPSPVQRRSSSNSHRLLSLEHATIPSHPVVPTAAIVVSPMAPTHCRRCQSQPLLTSSVPTAAVVVKPLAIAHLGPNQGLVNNLKSTLSNIIPTYPPHTMLTADSPATSTLKIMSTRVAYLCHVNCQFDKCDLNTPSHIDLLIATLMLPTTVLIRTSPTIHWPSRC